MRITLYFLIIFGAFSISNANVTLVADDDDKEKAERFHFLLDGMKFEREKLVSGVVRGKGERTIITRTPDEKVINGAGPVEYFIAFDFLEGKQRVDRNEIRLKAGKDDPVRCRGQYIERGDTMEYFSSLSDDDLTYGVIFVAQPKEGNYDFRNKDFCHPLDIRSVGILDVWRFTHGDEGRSFVDRINGLKQRIPEVLVEEENGMVRYEYHGRYQQYSVTSAIWIDTKNGFTQRKYRSTWEHDLRKGQPRTEVEVQVSWGKKEGVWVPTDVIMENNPHVEEQEKLVMSFDWESVNKPVNQDYFTYCDFDAFDHAAVAAVPLKGSGGASVPLGDYINNCGTKEGRLLMKELSEKESTRHIWQRTFTIAGVFLIALGLFLRLYRYRFGLTS